MQRSIDVFAMRASLLTVAAVALVVLALCEMGLALLPVAWWRG